MQCHHLALMHRNAKWMTNFSGKISKILDEIVKLHSVVVFLVMKSRIIASLTFLFHISRILQFGLNFTTFENLNPDTSYVRKQMSPE